MPRSLRDIAAALEQSRQGVFPSIQAFPPVDREEVARELNLYVRAAESGQHNQPKSAAVAPDPAEKEIGTAIEGLARKGAEEYRSQIDVYDSRIRGSAITDAELVEIEATCDSALGDLEARVIDDLNHLYPWRDALRDAETELQAFRARNALTRPPKVVSPGRKLLRILILAILVVLGGLANGRFFAEAGEAGRIGDAARALLLSLVNIGVAIFYARNGLPRLFDRRFGPKLVGMASTCAFLGWALVMNLLIGHSRDVSIAHQGRVPMSELSRHVASAPLALDDSGSWLLAMLGLGASVIAVIVAAGMDDFHPGYGALGRRKATAIEAYRKETSRCLEGLTSVRDAALEDIGSFIEGMRGLEQQLHLATEQLSRLHREFGTHLDHLAAIHEQLCLRYREINERTRSSSVPRYFRLEVQRPPCLQLPDPPVLTGPAHEALARVTERMEHHARSLNSAFVAALPRYQLPEEPAADGDEPDATA